MRNLTGALATTLASALVATVLWSPLARADEDAPRNPGEWLGVTVQSLNDNWRDTWSYRGAGVLVLDVEPQGPADRIGVVPGDILVALESTSLRRETDLEVAHGRIDPSQAISVVIARDHGRLLKITKIDPIPVPEAEPQAEETPAEATPSDLEATEPEPEVEPAPAPIEAARKAEPAPDSNSRWSAFGARCVDLNPDLAASLKGTTREGVLVLGVTPGGGADRAGIRAGDVITGIVGKPVARVEDLESVLTAAPGEVAIHTVRNYEEKTVGVSLDPPPAPGDPAPSAKTDEAAMRSELQTLRREVAKLREQLGVGAQ